MSGLGGMSVAIAGAGALGSCLALSLTRAGARVTLIDPGGPNASSVAAGMIAPVFEAVLDGETGVEFGLLARAAGLWDGLAASLGLTLDRSGALAVGGAQALARWEGLARGLGAPVRRLSRAEAEGRVAGLRAPAGALFSDLDARLEPERALAALEAANAAAGVARKHGHLATFADKRGTLADGEPIEADVWVIATGAARELQAQAPELAALAPIKGHILRLSDGPVRGPMVRMARGYVCPGETGAVVGASMEAGRRDTAVDPAIVAALLNQARAAFPDLGDTGVTALTGVRAATADGLPLAGASATPGVWIAAGARRNGWLLAPLIAQGLTAAIAGDRGDLPAAFDPQRFG